MERFIQFNLSISKKGRKSSDVDKFILHDYALICQNLISLKPMHQIVRNASDTSHWQSQGEDPYFFLDTNSDGLITTDWHEVELCMHTPYKRTNAKFYFDTGMGFNEAGSITLTTESGQPARRIFKLTKTARAIRFDPSETEGAFQVKTLRFDKIGESHARSGMLQHLVSQCLDFTDLTTEVAWQRIASEAKLLNLEPLKHLLIRYNETFGTRPNPIAYEEWLENVETPSLPTPKIVLATLENIGLKPLISIVMPVYNTPDIYLRACIDSVLAQSYPHWELCIADDNSSKEHVRQILRDYEQKESRIHVVYRHENGHISSASNSALDIASGEYVALLDHDDVLPEHALYFMVQAINYNPDAQILYSDEDKLDANGQRFDPHFKSDWNPDLFYSTNYISHLGVYKLALLNSINGFRTGVEGSQDQDLLLRCLPHVENNQIIHIPRILYHWRAVEGSTALASEEKNYTTEVGIKALTDYFKKNGPLGIKVEAGPAPNTYRVRWPIPEPAPLVSLLIPTRDKKTITEVAVRSILEKTTYPNYEIIILDNGSVMSETIEWFETIQRQDARVKVIRYDHPFNYSAINNFGVRQAKGDLIGLINNDVEVISSDWLIEMVSHALREDIGCVGAKLYYNNDTIQHAGIIMGLGGVAAHSHKLFPRDHPGYFRRLQLTQNLSGVTAACLIVRKSVFDQVGGLDECNLKVAFNDVDFCLKVREAGYRNIWTPYAELYHHESISRGQEDTPEKQERFSKEIEFMLSKWGNILKADPYYNPNLTIHREDFTI
ncbi:glycosyltransferase family 2 protein [Acidithiobacillus sp. HP-6]|nr:glycosyltransferase family 2 protein [Acidithiobacillus sp. HP-6]MBE7570905.1 glycosyltransferase family 2 protein [Acidithiobacillus sp. HP-2]